MSAATAAPIAHNVPDHVPPHLVFEFDIYQDTRLTEDLHESYEKLHDLAPDIFYTPCNGGHWIVTRYDDMFEVLRDFKTFSVREMQIPRVPNPPVFIPLSLDPPQSVPYRRALAPLFLPEKVAAMEPKIRRFAIEKIEAVLAQGKCDFVKDVSAQFPVSVFMELMGMPLEKLDEFRVIADNYFNARTQEQITASSGQIIGIMTELIEMRRNDPKDDLISHMLGFEIEGRPISLEELQSMCFIFFLGGMDTVTNLSAYMFRHMAKNPALQSRLVNEPEIVPNFLEEAIRCFGVINDPRIVTHDCEQFGIQFREGDMVLCVTTLAGRDDRKTDNPNEFNPDRPNIEHLTFSSGPHTCIGQHLARMEMRILLEEWIKRVPAFRATEGVPHTSRYGTVMALETLPLEWDV